MTASDKYALGILNETWEDSREYKSYCIGYAQGLYQFYKNFKHDNGIDIANKCFSSIFNGTDLRNQYFRKLVELDDAPDDEVKSFYENFRNLHRS